MRLKLLDRSDINRYGGMEADVPDHTAKRLIDLGRAVVMGVSKAPSDKMVQNPNRDKMVWTPPESKALDRMRRAPDDHDIIRFPGVNDPLFPSAIIA